MAAVATARTGSRFGDVGGWVYPASVQAAYAAGNLEICSHRDASDLFF